MHLSDTIFSLLAQSTTTPGTGTPPSGWFEVLRSFGPFILIIAVFYFLVFNSKRKQDRERKDLLSNLKRGDRVRMVGGELGSIVEVRDTEVLVKVDESSNTKIRYVRDAVAQVMESASGAKPGTAAAEKEKAEAK